MLIGGDIIENREVFAQLIDLTAKTLSLPKLVKRRAIIPS